MWVWERERPFPIWALPLAYVLYNLGQIIYLNFTDEETKALMVLEDSPYEVILRTSKNERGTLSTGLALSGNSLHENNRLP